MLGSVRNTLKTLLLPSPAGLIVYLDWNFKYALVVFPDRPFGVGFGVSPPPHPSTANRFGVSTFPLIHIVRGLLPGEKPRFPSV